MEQDRIKLIEEMLETNPEDSFLNYAAALEYYKAGDAKRSIEVIEALLERDPDYLGAYYKLGKIYEELNDTETAISTYKKGKKIAIERKDLKTHGELTEALMILGADEGETDW